MSKVDIVLSIEEVGGCGIKLQTAAEGIKAQIEEITPEGNLDGWNNYYQKYKEMSVIMGSYKALLLQDRSRINSAVAEFFRTELELLE